MMRFPRRSLQERKIIRERERERREKREKAMADAKASQRTKKIASREREKRLKMACKVKNPPPLRAVPASRTNPQTASPASQHFSALCHPQMLSCPMAMCKIREKKTIDAEIKLKSKFGGSGVYANPRGRPVCSRYRPVRDLRHVPSRLSQDLH